MACGVVPWPEWLERGTPLWSCRGRGDHHGAPCSGGPKARLGPIDCYWGCAGAPRADGGRGEALQQPAAMAALAGVGGCRHWPLSVGEGERRGHLGACGCPGVRLGRAPLLAASWPPHLLLCLGRAGGMRGREIREGEREEQMGEDKTM